MTNEYNEVICKLFVSTEMLQIRLGEVDERELDRRAKGMGMTRSALVRHLIRFGKLEGECSDSVVTEDEGVVTDELQRSYDGPVVKDMSRVEELKREGKLVTGAELLKKASPEGKPREETWWGRYSGPVPKGSTKFNHVKKHINL